MYNPLVYRFLVRDLLGIVCVLSIFSYHSLFAEPTSTQQKLTEQSSDEIIPTNSIDSLREAIKKYEEEWDKNRSVNIMLLDIKGLKAIDGDEEKTALSSRLETLQNKKIFHVLLFLFQMIFGLVERLKIL